MRCLDIVKNLRKSTFLEFPETA